ncbi:MAG: hypothetical protein ACLFN8_03055 [Candidatus Woesearchaeota archaeon]
MLIHTIFKIINFLTSTLGTIILIALSATLGQEILYSSLTGLLIVTIILIISKTSLRKIRLFKQYAKQKGATREQRQNLKTRLENKFFSGHIARAFLIGFIIFTYHYFLIIIATIFCALTIITMMKLRGVSIIKILMSATLGTSAGVISVIISNLII